MNDRKEAILRSALKLFSREGYKASSTHKIAKYANVSESLIYRHYGNKKSLLQTVLKAGEDKFIEIINDILAEKDAQAFIEKTISLPFLIPAEDLDFWRLQFKLKWESESFNTIDLEVLRPSLIKAFNKLNYEDPKLESDILLHLINGISFFIFTDPTSNQDQLKLHLIKKYS